jgi:hypothetical protein
MLRLDLMANRCCRRFLLADVLVYFVTMAQVVGNHDVNLGEFERWEAFKNLFGRVAPSIRRNHGLQRDLRTAHTDHAVFVSSRRHGTFELPVLHSLVLLYRGCASRL